MSIVYHIDKEKGITYVVWDGVIGAGQYLSHVKRLIANSDWPPYRALHLTDLRSSLLEPSIDESVLKAAAGMFGEHPKIATVKTAIVAHRAFEKAVLYERLISDVEPSVIVFHDLVTACVWLGIEVESATRVLQSLRNLSQQEQPFI